MTIIEAPLTVEADTFAVVRIHFSVVQGPHIVIVVGVEHIEHAITISSTVQIVGVHVYERIVVRIYGYVSQAEVEVAL